MSVCHEQQPQLQPAPPATTAACDDERAADAAIRLPRWQPSIEPSGAVVGGGTGAWAPIITATAVITAAVANADQQETITITVIAVIEQITTTTTVMLLLLLTSTARYCD